MSAPHIALLNNSDYALIGPIQDALDSKDANRNPKYQSDATGTWEIRTEPQGAGVQVANGAIVALGSGMYACLMSHQIAMLADQGYYLRSILTLASGYVWDTDTPFTTAIRTGETANT